MKRKSFAECRTDGQLAKVSNPDPEVAQALLDLAKHRRDFWKTVKREETYPTLYIEGHYEIIKEFCAAVIALDGWITTNHECLFAYLKEHRRDVDIDFEYLTDLKDLRNTIDYRGMQISPDLWSHNNVRIQESIEVLTAYVSNRLGALS